MLLLLQQISCTWGLNTFLDASKFNNLDLQFFVTSEISITFVTKWHWLNLSCSNVSTSITTIQTFACDHFSSSLKNKKKSKHRTTSHGDSIVLRGQCGASQRRHIAPYSRGQHTTRLLLSESDSRSARFSSNKQPPECRSAWAHTSLSLRITQRNLEIRIPGWC